MKLLNLLPATTLLGLGLLTGAPLAAHDFWVEPQAFEVEAGKPVALRLRVGEHFVGDTVMPRSGAIASFFARDLEGTMPVQTSPGAEPVGLVAARHSGLLAVGYESRPSAITLEAERFEGYLREEGLEHVIAERARRGESLVPGRELFARSAKSLIRIDEAAGAAAILEPIILEPIGLPLELVPAADPYNLKAERSLPFDLLYQGRPVAGVLVIAMPQADPASAQRARTDDSGRVTFDLEQSGTWLIKAVHMASAPAEADAEWSSLWASLTFSIPGS